MRNRTREHRRRRDAGASAVEMAFLLPFLLLIVGGLLDLGLMFNAQLQLTNAAREGARMAALGKPLGSSSSNSDDIWTRAKNASPNIKNRSDFTVTLDTPACTPASAAQVTVSLTNYQFLILGPIMRFIGRTSTTTTGAALTSTAQMRCA